MSDTRQYKTFVGAIQHRFRLLLLVLATCLIGGAVAIKVVPTSYEATAYLYVDVRGQDNALRQSDGLLSDYYVQYAQSQAVLSRALSALNLAGVSPSTLAKSVSSQVVGATPTVA